MSTSITPYHEHSTRVLDASSAEAWELVGRKAQALASSTIVPPDYRNKPQNCLIAMDVAQRTGVPVLTVMQNLNVINNRPSWGSVFLIAAINSCGRFSPLRYRYQGEEGSDEWGCRAVAVDLKSNEELPGSLITIAMAKAEGWYQRNGSKWKTMPEQMLAYRAAAFWARRYAPEVAVGLQTSEEVEDMGPVHTVRAAELASVLDAPDIDEPPIDALRAQLSELMEWFPAFEGDLTKAQSRTFVTATQVYDDENASAQDIEEQINTLRALQAELQPQGALV